MVPILVSVGFIHIYSFSIFLVLSWLVFSFFFWKRLKDEGIEEEGIYDCMFLMTLSSFVVSRLVFVASHWASFSSYPLKIATIWVMPGLSFFGAIAGALIVLLITSRRYRVQLTILLDAWCSSFIVAATICVIGTFLDGTYIGIRGSIPWGVKYVGYADIRHPVQLYELIIYVIIVVLLAGINKRNKKNKLPFGRITIFFVLLFSFAEFVIEFFKESSVYLGKFTLNQWLYILLFGQAIGFFLVSEQIHKKSIRLLLHLYDTVHKRFARKNTTTT